jgi:hypothetical protein
MSRRAWSSDSLCSKTFSSCRACSASALRTFFSSSLQRFSSSSISAWRASSPASSASGAWKLTVWRVNWWPSRFTITVPGASASRMRASGVPSTATTPASQSATAPATAGSDTCILDASGKPATGAFIGCEPWSKTLAFTGG